MKCEDPENFNFLFSFIFFHVLKATAISVLGVSAPKMRRDTSRHVMENNFESSKIL